MKHANTDSLGNSKMAVECAAHLAVAATLLQHAPYGPMSYFSPGELAVHVVNDACKRGSLGFLHTALTEHLR